MSYRFGLANKVQAQAPFSTVRAVIEVDVSQLKGWSTSSIAMQVVERACLCLNLHFNDRRQLKTKGAWKV